MGGQVLRHLRRMGLVMLPQLLLLCQAQQFPGIAQDARLGTRALKLLVKDEHQASRLNVPKSYIDAVSAYARAHTHTRARARLAQQSSRLSVEG
jgi:hypothetical protein